MGRRRGLHPVVRAWLLIVLLVVIVGRCRDQSSPPSTGQVGRTAEAPAAPTREIDKAVEPAEVTTAEPRPGLAAAIAIDVSGSMDDRVTGEDGRRARKIDVARRAARELVAQFAAYAAEHPDEPVTLGLFEFSRRDNQPDCRPIVPVGRPNVETAEAALARLDPEGGTPIGTAMIVAKRALDGSGVVRRHLLVISDGENTDGYRPEDVAAAIGRRPDDEKPSMYFVAFDVDSRRFNRLRDAGVLVLGAANARELNDTLDMLLRGKILLEK